MSCRSLLVRLRLWTESSSLPSFASRQSNKEFRDNFVTLSLVPSSSDCHVPSADQRGSALQQSVHPNRSALALSQHLQPPGLSDCYFDHDDAGVGVTQCVHLPSNAG